MRKNAALAQAVRDPRAINMIRYAASQGGQPLNFIQTVLVEPLKVKKKDPQSDAPRRYVPRDVQGLAVPAGRR